MNSPIQIPSKPRILIRGTNWLGDAVMTTPALLRLRGKFPEAKISILTPEKLKDLWLHHPAVDEIISFASDENIFAVAKKLHGGKFDFALVLPNSPRSAMEVFFARIPKRIGYARPWRNFFLTQTVSPRADAVKMQKRSTAEIKKLIAGEKSGKRKAESGSIHQIHGYLHLVSALGANSAPWPTKLVVTPEEIEAVKKKFDLGKISNPIFGLNPGAEYGLAKRWPVENFISTAKEIQAKTDCAWILFGGKNDLPITNQIESEIKNSKFEIRNLCGKTTLRELMASLKCCRVLLTNDTGPMHVAAALGVPVIAIFGSTSPALTGPISSSTVQIVQANAPCSPCFLRECPIDFRCMRSIEIGWVVNAVLQVSVESVPHK